MQIAFSVEDKKQLLSSARASIQSVFENIPSPAIDYSHYPILKLKAGVFVTLRINENLRGCIGYIYSQLTLFEAVCDAAKLAAFNDVRFLPLSAAEFKAAKIEISVLSFPAAIKDYSEIKIGVHGLLLNDMENKALLLPQVAVENNFNTEKFLCALCEKAGMKNIFVWQKRKLNLSAFTAQVFSEI